MKFPTAFACGCCLLFACAGPAKEAAADPEPGLPNIVLILADDLGYGDPGVYNSDSKIPTPNIDRLAAGGMRFTDAHTTSAVCTPTRYGIVTGQYSWRGPLKRGVTWSYDSLIVDTAETTIASVLGDGGYATGCIGKWHLGLGWQFDGEAVAFDRPLTSSPNDLGFDHFYGITASLDIPPYVYLRDREVVVQPNDSTQGTAPAYYDDYWRMGPVSPDFDHFTALDHLTDRAEDFIAERAGERPFFLYFPLTAPHLPWIPRPEFRGVSGAGNYGDLAAEVDDVVGRIVRAVEAAGVSENTLIIFTSDNGSQFSSARMEEYGHRANGVWRGRKGDIFEGGHRVPFIACWPGRIPAGSVTDALVSTTDFYATFADLLGLPPAPAGEVKDSHSFLPVLTGDQPEGLRNSMVYHSSEGKFALRAQDFVLIEGRGSGGFMEVADTLLTDPPHQLYDLSADSTQGLNLYAEQPERVRELRQRLSEVRDPSR